MVAQEHGEIPVDLIEQVRQRRAILFVGAGVSAGLGVPAWRGLIEHLGQSLGYDPEVFCGYTDSFLALAEYYRIRAGSFAAVRDWMTREWNVSDGALRESRVHELLIELNFPLIYTTNFDQFIERAFEVRGKCFNKVVSVADLSKVEASLPTIIKFHGDMDDEQSLMLCETDYFRRLTFESPLDIKLRADTLGSSVLFIGYSLSDVNVRMMLYRMKSMWLESGHRLPQPCSYIFMPRPNPVQEAILQSWGVMPIVGDRHDAEDALLVFLTRLAERSRKPAD